MKRSSRAAATFVVVVLLYAPALAQATTPAPLTAAEVQAFAAQVCDVLARHDGRAFVNLFEADRVADDVVGVLDRFKLGPSALNVYRTGSRQQLQRMLEPNASDRTAVWRYTGVRGSQDRPELVFRLQSPDPKAPRLFEYRALVVARGSNGGARAVDLILCPRGTSVVEMLRMELLAHHVKSYGAPGYDDPALTQFLHVREATDRVRQMARTGDPALALAVCEALPESVRWASETLYCRLEIAARSSDKELERALADMAARRPDELIVNLFLLPGVLARGEHERALEVIGRIEGRIGRDPYLSSKRGTVAAQRKEFDKARAHFEDAAQRDPDLYEPHEWLLEAAVARRDHAETLRLLRLLKQRFATDYGDLNNEPRFADFVRSPEYQQWRHPRATSAPPATLPSWKF